MFAFQRRSASGHSVPSWLAAPGKVLLKRHVRRSKYEPLVDEVEVIDANPQYAHVKLPSGQETTVSVRDLAPTGDIPVCSDGGGAILRPGTAGESAAQDPELIPAEYDIHFEPRGTTVNPPDASPGITDEACDTSGVRTARCVVPCVKDELQSS